MKKISPLLRDSANRGRAVDERITGAEKRYSWWFDNPINWERPVRTLYITGWCVNRRGKDIRAIRARIGRQKFFGNYGIQRKDVAAALGPIAVERIGFAIAVRLPPGKSEIVTEVQEADHIWRTIANRGRLRCPDKDSEAHGDWCGCTNFLAAFEYMPERGFPIFEIGNDLDIRH